jgi:hypothetical protein
VEYLRPPTKITAEIPLPSQQQIQRNYDEDLQRALNREAQLIRGSMVSDSASASADEGAIGICDFSDPDSLETAEIPTPISED